MQVSAFAAQGFHFFNQPYDWKPIFGDNKWNVADNKLSRIPYWHQDYGKGILTSVLEARINYGWLFCRDIACFVCAMAYNKYYNIIEITQDARYAFFNGKRFVPICLIYASTIV